MDARLKRQGDERLSSGSIIHWGERDPLNVTRAAITCGRCGQKRLATIQRGANKARWTGLCASCSGLQLEDEVLSSGSVIHWGERDKADCTRIKVTCGLCQRNRFTKPKRGRSHRWLGICPECIGRHLQKTQDQVLSSGSVIHWSERDPENPRSAPVTCGRCGKRRVVTIQRSSRWTGLCQGCAATRDIDQPLRSGSIIHWSERNLEDKKLVPVTCGRCRKRRSCTRSTAGARTFTGLCTNCVIPLAHRITQKPRADETLPSGSIVHWSERDPNNHARGMVTCGLCSRKRFTVLRHGKGKEKWTGYCEDHLTPSGLTKLAQQLQQAPYKGSSEDKQKRGRRAGVKYIDPQASRTSLESAIKKLWAQSQSISDITYSAAAEVFQSTGERIGADAVKKRFYQLATGMKWRDFVLIVVSQKGN
jgi:hypothetical protein